MGVLTINELAGLGEQRKWWEWLVLPGRAARRDVVRFVAGKSVSEYEKEAASAEARGKLAVELAMKRRAAAKAAQAAAQLKKRAEARRAYYERRDREREAQYARQTDPARIKQWKAHMTRVRPAPKGPKERRVPGALSFKAPVSTKPVSPVKAGIVAGMTIPPVARRGGGVFVQSGHAVTSRGAQVVMGPGVHWEG